MTSEINGNASEKKAPLYMKIYEIILSRIETGQYPENSSLPSELDFQKEFNVSRITIRRSLKDLEDAGYISRKRGKLGRPVGSRHRGMGRGDVVGKVDDIVVSVGIRVMLIHVVLLSRVPWPPG